jgi:hypothetical protein
MPGEAYFVNKKSATIVSPNIKVYSEGEIEIDIRCYKNETSGICLLKGIAYINSTRLKVDVCVYVNGQTRIILFGSDNHSANVQCF